MEDPKLNRKALAEFLMNRLCIAHDSLNSELNKFEHNFRINPLNAFEQSEDALRASATMDLHRRLERLLIQVDDPQHPMTFEQMLTTMDDKADQVMIEALASHPLAPTRAARVARADRWYRQWVRAKAFPKQASSGKAFTTLRAEVLALYDDAPAGTHRDAGTSP